MNAKAGAGLLQFAQAPDLSRIRVIAEGFPNMSSSRRKLQVVASLGVLLLMAVGVGCHGFFVDPVLTSISVSTLQSTNLPNVGSTLQLQATGVNDDGSHKNLTGTATWSVTSNPDFVSVNAAGLVTALKLPTTGSTSSSTVQAAAQSSNGSVVSGTITVTVGKATTLTINSSLGTTISLATDPTGTAITFTASLNGNDVTSSTTFASSNSNIINITSGSSGTIAGTTGTVTITGTDSTDSATGTLQITVTQ